MMRSMGERKLQLGAVSLLFIGFVVRLYLGWNLPSIYWPDEVIQTLEQAHRLVFGYGEVPWEYEKGLRSWLFPGFLAGVIQLTESFGPGSMGYLFGVMACLCAVSLIPAVVTYRWARREGKQIAALTAMAVPLVWMELVYFAPKALFEVFTAHLLIGGIYLVRYADASWWRPVAGGVILGLCCVMRLQLAPAVAMVGLAVPLFADYPHRRFSALVLGAGAGLAVGGLVDMFVWGAPFHSVVSNYYVNLIEGRASNWGTSPYWQYGAWLWRVSPVGTLLLAGGLGLGLVRYPLIAWPAVALVTVHSYVGHKEYRFIYPAVVLGAVVVGLWAGAIGRAARDVVGSKMGRWTWGVASVVNVCLVVGMTAVSVNAGLDFDLRSRGGTAHPNNWSLHGGKVRAARMVSLRDDVCGVALHGFGSYVSGGYAYLHHDVPFQRFGTGKPLARQLNEGGESVNVVISTAWSRGDERPAGYTLDRCLPNSQTCVLVRSGDCETEGAD